TGEAVTAVRSLLQTLGDGEDQPVTGWPAGAGEAPRVAGWLGPANLARIGRAFLDEGTIGDLEIAEDRALCATFRDFARREIAPVAQAIHRQDADIPDDLIRKLAHLGLFGLSIPVEYGGSQDRLADYRSMLIATEELSRASLTVGGSLMTRPEIIVRAILRAGTETQKRRWLPAIASGDKLVAVATTEPDHGSDLGGIRCRASREGDGSWTVNGTKLWCTFAGRAHLLMLLVRTGKAGPGGLSVFVVEKPSFPGQAFDHRQDGGGVLLGRAIPTIGYRGMHTFELVFDDFRLPAEALLGGLDWLNRGFGLQLEGFAVGRLQTAGRAVGLMQAALTDALAYARQRSVFGNPIGAYQLPQVMLGWMAVRTNAARQISYQAARALTQGGGQADAALAKLYAARMAEFVARDAMQLHGAMGYGEETPVSRYFVDARVLTIFEGTEEVLALRVIARSMLDPKGASGEHAGVSTSHRAR
ncbi:MAG TPA: acyl-CoA dehydrogenase family protein, partial [Candidatus Dormibacteraeota bacterium]